MEVLAKGFSETKVNFCKLYLTEKVFIINALNDSSLLNKNIRFNKYISPSEQTIAKIVVKK